MIASIDHHLGSRSSVTTVAASVGQLLHLVATGEQPSVTELLRVVHGASHLSVVYFLNNVKVVADCSELQIYFRNYGRLMVSILDQSV